MVASKGAGEPAKEQGTDQAATEVTSPSTDRRHRDTASCPADVTGEQRSERERLEQVDNGDGGGSAGLTSLLGYYGSDSDAS